MKNVYKQRIIQCIEEGCVNTFIKLNPQHVRCSRCAGTRRLLRIEAQRQQRRAEKLKTEGNKNVG